MTSCSRFPDPAVETNAPSKSGSGGFAAPGKLRRGRVACARMLGLCATAYEGGGGSRDKLAVVKSGKVADVSLRAFLDGVRINMSRPAAFEVCPDLNVVRYDRSKYEALMFEAAREISMYTPLVEIVPDEIAQVFMGFASNEDVPATLMELSREVFPRFFQAGVTVVSGSKFLSKAVCDRTFKAFAENGSFLASFTVTNQVDDADLPRRGLKNPRCWNILLDLTPAEESRWASGLGIDDLWIVPAQVRKTLSALGFHAVRQVARADENALERVLGPLARRVMKVCRGELGEKVPPWPFEDEREWRFRLDEPVESVESLKRYIGLAAAELEEEGKSAPGALIRRGIREGNLRLSFVAPLVGDLSVNEERRWPFPLTDASCLARALCDMLEAAVRKAAKFAIAEVQLEGMEMEMNIRVRACDADEGGAPLQQLLFLPDFRRSRDEKWQRATWAMKKLNEKYKRQVVRTGSGEKPGRRELLLSVWDPVRHGLPLKARSTAPAKFAVESAEVWPEGGAWWEGEGESKCSRKFGLDGTIVESLDVLPTFTFTRRFPS